MRRWLTHLARRTVRTPEVYGLLRTGMLAYQYAMRRADEPDLRLLGRMPEHSNELILDIGANGGQSAVALAFIRPRARILSFEPVPALWPELQRVRKILGPRYDFRKCALGDSTGTASLYIPVSGRLPITTRASLSEDEAKHHCQELERNVGLPATIMRIDAEVRMGDSQNVAPTAIKIDVEGAEREVLAGFSRTIEQARPVVLLERSASFADCARYFADRDYALLTHDGAGPGEVPLLGLSERNWIAAPIEALRYMDPSRG